MIFVDCSSAGSDTLATKVANGFLSVGRCHVEISVMSL